MDVREISIIYHVAIVIGLLWVHECYIVRLRKKLQFEERKQANQKRLLSDSESVRWLNHAVEKVWPICMEQITSQKVLLPIIPWFLDKFKPWTAKEAVVQHLYLGRTPPIFTEMRVLRQCSDDDHLVLELGMNFLTADDMSAILAVKLRRRLGFGMWAKLHVTGMHIEGKVLVGVKFLRQWPFLGRLRVCFSEPPYFQMTVKPIVSHGLDVTELPGIAGWLDKLLSVAFEQTLVEPNMLVVDMEKFVSTSPESWFTVDEKDPIAHVMVEVIEAADMKPSDPNGLADPYVKGQLGPYRFRTKTQKKTLAPKWHEEFKIPIFTWESPNVLLLEVRDKDHFVDDTLGDCSFNISDGRDGQRHDMWLPLKKIKMGRLHVAVTVLDVNVKDEDYSQEDNALNWKESKNANASETTKEVPNSTTSSKMPEKMRDKFEAINVEGQQQTGIWVHSPGGDISQTWEPRKRSRKADIKVHREENDTMDTPRSVVSGSSDENAEGNKSKPRGTVRRSLRKIGSVFHKRNSRADEPGSSAEPSPTNHINIRAVNEKGVSLNIIRDDGTLKECVISPERNEAMSPGKSNMKGMAKSILKHAEHGLKHVLSRKGSSKSRGDCAQDSDSSQSSSLSSNRFTPTGVDNSGPKEQEESMRYEEPGVKTVSFDGSEDTEIPDVHYDGRADECLDSTIIEKSSQEENK